jgi:hypothetical protein
VVVDTTGTVQWFWNPYLSFDPGRRAILGEKCNSTEGYNGGCPITLATVANDWMHGNSLYFDANRLESGLHSQVPGLGFEAQLPERGGQWQHRSGV